MEEAREQVVAHVGAVEGPALVAVLEELHLVRRAPHHHAGEHWVQTLQIGGGRGRDARHRRARALSGSNRDLPLQNAVPNIK